MGIVSDAVIDAGGQKIVSEKMGVTLTAVANYMKKEQVPPSRLLDFERVTGVSRCDLAPDLFAGYRKSYSSDKQFIPDFNDAVFLIASHVVEKANNSKANNESIDSYKGAMISLYDLAKVIGMSEIVTSTLFLFSQLLSCQEAAISPIDYDLLLERGRIDPVVINKMFMPS
ncbi:helix-turn-helix domain-containing protein [Vibrio parahaemolyticus]|nr:helix-turn-helix domain-containing protein [Vibrio parahaemolyticus]